MGFASNPNWVDWDNADITGQGGEELLSALKDYRASFKVLKNVWRDTYGEEIDV